MADKTNKPPGADPQGSMNVSYKNPRRTSPENSVTLRHHRIAREPSKRNAPPAIPHVETTGASPRRNDSDESNETGFSDPKKWFDKSNRNLAGVFDTTSMEVDPPFFQKETDSSNEEGVKDAVPHPLQSPAFRLGQGRHTGLLRPSLTHSSSADDYRSVIDDLTIENKRLREELKRYRQMGPDSLRREKLFEVKVHGLPSRKKRELEAALRDFTTSLDGSSTGVSPKRKKDKGSNKGVKSSISKHASSSSGSRSRQQPTDSAYASMSTDPSSSNLSLPSKRVRSSADQAVQQYLQDIPEGLWPRRMVISENDKKKLVVKRLEYIFTGKGTEQPAGQDAGVGGSEDVEMTTPDNQIPLSTEAIREAQISLHPRGKESHSRDNESSNSNGDQTDSRDNGNGSGSGSGSGGRNNTSPPDAATPQQRPTRPRDLDPDRAQNPSENMQYIRHLGLAAPQVKQFSSRDVSPDAEGWVYLNLLCNLAQLHILNVTPDFIRSAVSEKSTQFQLSPDGRKIRWRGGVEGTKFTSDSSGSNSQRENSDDTDGSNEQDQRKKQKTQGSGNDIIVSEPSKFGPQVSSSSDSFHYKPLFVHQQTSSSEEQPSLGDETGSSYGPAEDSNLGMTSKWNQSGVSGVSQRKRRRDGAIIYYTGAPFCTDLSGDFADSSGDSENNQKSESAGLDMNPPKFSRTSSGSSIPFKPLSSLVSHHAMMDLDFAPPEMIPDEGSVSDDINADFPWSDSSQSSFVTTKFDASGLAGIYPDDNFVVIVATRRPKSIPRDHSKRPDLLQRASEETTISRDTTDSIASKLASMSTASPLLVHVSKKDQIIAFEIEYISGKVKRLPPAPLPPASYFFNAATETTSDDETEFWSDNDGISRRRSERRSLIRPPIPMSGNEEFSSGDEEDEEDDDAYDDSGNSSPDKIGEITDNVGELGIGRRASGRVSDLSKLTRGSSAATAGGAPSGYSSMGDV